MTSFVSHTTVDCTHAYELSEWWKQLLGYVDIEGDPNLPGHVECLIRDAETGHQILFIEVPDGKSVKNRIHFDLRPRTGTRDDEIERVRVLGARRSTGQHKEYGEGPGGAGHPPSVGAGIVVAGCRSWVRACGT